MPRLQIHLDVSVCVCLRVFQLKDLGLDRERADTKGRVWPKTAAVTHQAIEIGDHLRLKPFRD